MNERMDVRYGPYRLVAASYKGDFQAVAYLGRQETLRVSGQSLVEAMADLQVRIEANRAAQLAARGDGEPSPEEYRTALEGYRRLVSPDALTMLHQHASLPDHRSTISDARTVLPPRCRCRAQGLYPARPSGRRCPDIQARRQVRVQGSSIAQLMYDRSGRT